MANAKPKPVPMRSRRSGVKKKKLVDANLEILKKFEKNVTIGSPIVLTNGITGGGSTASINTTTQLNVAWATGATGYQWTVAPLSSGCVDFNGIPIGGVTLPKFSNGLNKNRM